MLRRQRFHGERAVLRVRWWSCWWHVRADHHAGAVRSTLYETYARADDVVAVGGAVDDACAHNHLRANVTLRERRFDHGLLG